MTDEAMHEPSSLERYVRSLYSQFSSSNMPSWQGGLLIGFLNVLMFSMLNMSFGAFGGTFLWGTWIYNLIGVKVAPSFGSLVPPHLDIATALNVGLVLGVLAAALFAREFKLRRDSVAGYVQGVVGGAMLGMGTVLVSACNVAGFFSAVSALSLSGFGMMVGLIPGAYVGRAFLLWQAERKIREMILKMPEVSVVETHGNMESGGISRQPKFSILILILALALIGLYMSMGLTQLGGVLFFGLLFGVVIQRSRLCFAAAFRDIFSVKGGRLMKSIIYGVTVGILGFSVIKFLGWRAWDVFVFPFGLHSFVGGFVFGVGMIVTGGCGVGILWRSAEGYVRMWFALISGIMVAAAWPLLYGAPVGQGWLYGQRTFIPSVLGWGGGVLATLAAVWLLYLTLVLAERRWKS